MKKRLFAGIVMMMAAATFAAADIEFKWDASGRTVAEPTGVPAAFASFDSVVRAANESAEPEATVRVPYRADFESDAQDVSTFRAGSCIIFR